ncbi:MAG: SulP family inorganic anion transporter [Sphingomonadales bacterium]|nr:SulP family inorganic anion transporter [Sphingomonadales bacterium]MDE2169177.1 SulP family inorganic anion transporter [Sphingomonadales bacterium]
MALVRDLPPGLSVAGVLVPEAVAYAGIAGLAPGRALIAGVAGGLTYALAGRSRFAILGPTSSSAAILGAALVSLSSLDDPALAHDPALRASLATGMIAIVGLLFLGLRLFRLGNLSGFISRPVLKGFAFGLALTIIVKQLPKLFGMAVASKSVWGVLHDLALGADRWNWPSLVLGGGTLAALLTARRWPALPGALIVLIAAMALGLLGHPESWGVALAGPVTLELPRLVMPPIALLPRMIQLAVPVALILFAESWGTMRSLAIRHGDVLEPNRELGALGLANLAAALAQGMPVGAGFSAGAANEAVGATSRASGLVVALALLALGLWAGPLIAHIPEPMLGAVVIAALTHALDIGAIRRLMVLHRDWQVALCAMLGVLVLGVLNGMLAAVALSVALLLYTLARPSLSHLGQLRERRHDFVDIARHSDTVPLPGVAIWRPNAPLIFANAETVLGLIARDPATLQARWVVLSLEESNDLDTTALDALSDFVKAQTSAGRKVMLARAHDRVRDALCADGMADLARGAAFSVADAVAAIAMANPFPSNP